MARPYSNDLRERVVASVAQGCSVRATAALVGERVERGEGVAAAATDPQRGAGQDGRACEADPAAGTGMAGGAIGGGTGPDAPGAFGRAAGARRQGALWCFVAALRA